MSGCDDCGFDFDTVGIDEIPGRTESGVAAIVELISACDGGVAGWRPEPERWSVIEYGAHVRDVMLTIRDRLVIGLVEDNAGFKPLYRDERIARGLYRADTAAAIAKELDAAAPMFLRLFTAIDPALLERVVQYGFPNPSPVTLAWMGKQAVHEIEHHLTDMQENVERSGNRSG